MGSSSFSSLLSNLLRGFLTFFRCVVSFLFDLLDPPQRGKIPPIRNSILLNSATELAENIRKGEFSSYQVVECFITRLQEINPIVNGLIEERFEEALCQAKDADDYIRQSGLSLAELASKKPLLGVPITIKSNIACKGLLHESGLVNRRGLRAQNDSFVTSRLKEAGAIILGTTNVPELSTSFHTYNKIYGSTKNPHDLTKSPGGSSGGESALISTGASVIGIGNDLCGSLRMPACVSGILSHKPTSGIISNNGVFPQPEEGNTIDKVLVQGPLCRFSQDLTLVMKVLATNFNDNVSRPNTVDFKTLKILYCWDDLEDPFTLRVSKETKMALKKILSLFEKKYGITPKKITPPDRDLVPWIVGAKNHSEGALKYSSLLVDNPKKELNIWLELTKNLLGLSQHTFDSLKFALLNKFMFCKNLNQLEEYSRVEKRQRLYYENIVDKNTIFICPSWPKTSSFPFECTIHDLNMSYYTLFGLVGAPVTQCPVGKDSKKYPIGVQIAGAPFQDHLTIAVAAEIEKEFGGWIKPCTIDLG